MSLSSWNTQGNNPTAYILNENAQGFNPPLRNLVPDFICMQEVGAGGWQGNLGGNIAAAWNPAVGPVGGYQQITNLTLNNNIYNGYLVSWQANAQGNQRCSMAILWLAAHGAHAAMPIYGWNDGNPAHRPVFWVTPNAGRRVGCIHAPSVNGGDMVYINGAIGAIANGAPAAGWILGGDFNKDPGTLAGMPPGVAAQHTNGFTHQGGGNYDYIIHNGAAPFANAGSAANFVQSDHLQVRFA